MQPPVKSPAQLAQVIVMPHVRHLAAAVRRYQGQYQSARYTYADRGESPSRKAVQQQGPQQVARHTRGRTPLNGDRAQRTSNSLRSFSCFIKRGQRRYSARWLFMHNRRIPGPTFVCACTGAHADQQLSLAQSRCFSSSVPGQAARCQSERGSDAQKKLARCQPLAPFRARHPSQKTLEEQTLGPCVSFSDDTAFVPCYAIYFLNLHATMLLQEVIN